MEITLNQLIDQAPELAMMLRSDIRQGRLTASRKTGVAGRPYVLDTEVLLASDRDAYRMLAQQLTNNPERLQSRRSAAPRSDGFRSTPSMGEEVWQPLLKMLESQHAMLQQMINVFLHEMQQSHDRYDRQSREMQEISYKLGQAHQKGERLERLVTERMGRQEQA